jgi:hypothetical protein
MVRLGKTGSLQRSSAEKREKKGIMFGYLCTGQLASVAEAGDKAKRGTIGFRGTDTVLL